MTFLDDDDLLTSDRLEIALKGIAAAPIAVCWRASVEGRGRAWRVSLEGDIGWRVLQGPVPHVGQVAIERAACPMFDPRFRVSEDVEWWIRTARIGHATTVHRVGYLQRDHGGDRQTTRLRERLSHRLLLLEVHADYFDANPRAAAYQWRRIGGLARATGDRALERRAFRHSLELNPGWRSLAHFGRSCLGTSTNHGN